jgi:hypothetical protein
MHYGATSKDWDAFIALSQRDLLPYLADPSTPMSSGSRILAGSKTPGRVLPDTGRGAGLMAWPSHYATDADILEWRADTRHGICLICRDYRAIDIDIPDLDQAKRVEQTVRDFLGRMGATMPVRVRPDSGKRCLLVRLPHDQPLRKWRVPTKHGVIEFLFDKQQTVVAGRHPDGERYEWEGGYPTPVNTPAISVGQMVELVGLIKAEYGLDDFGAEWGIVAPTMDPTRSKIDTSTDPVVVYLRDQGHIIEGSPDGAYYVRCPWEHEHTGETKYDAAKFYPAGVGRADAGYKCLHAHCLERNHHNYLDAVGYVDIEFPIEPAKGEKKPRPKMTYKGNSGKIEGTLSNAVKMLEWSDGTGMRIIYDAFKDTILYQLSEGDAWSELDDEAYTAIRLKLNLLGIDHTLPKQHVIDAVNYVARSEQKDSAQEWLTSLVWDGVERLNSFHERCLKLADTPYHRAVCRYLWTALVGRIMEPGIKADMVPVLTGAQGLRKSTFVELLPPTLAEYTALSMTERDADLSRKLRGKMVAEWAELRGIDTREAEEIKSWITYRADEWVPKYREFGTTRLRRFIIIGTNNRRRYLSDATGARRFLPVQISQTICTDYLKYNRDQLFAEAKQLFEESGVQWSDADSLAGPAREAAEVLDMWHIPISVWLGEQGNDGYDTSTIARQALGIPPGKLNKASQQRIVSVMIKLGWEEGSDNLWKSDLI